MTLFKKILKYIGIVFGVLLFLYILLGVWSAWDYYRQHMEIWEEWQEEGYESQYNNEKPIFWDYLYEDFRWRVDSIVFQFPVMTSDLSKSCSVDTDCVPVNRYCGCTTTGSYTVVNASEEEKISARVRNFCSYAHNLGVCSAYPYPVPKAICSQGQCELTSPY